MATGAEITGAVNAAKAAGRFVVYLRGLQHERTRTEEVLRDAIAASLCHADPANEVVRSRAERMAAWFWEVPPPKGATDWMKRRAISVKGKLRGIRRTLDPRLSEWPYWREEICDELRKTVSNADLRDLAKKAHCHEAPRTVDALVERFPKEVLLKLQDRADMDQFAVALLASLQNADEMRARFEPPRSGHVLAWLAPPVTAAAAAGASAAAELATHQGVVATGAGLVAGAVVGKAGERHAARSAGRRRGVLAAVRSWALGCSEALAARGDGPYPVERYRADLSERLIERVDDVGEETLVDLLIEVEDLLVRYERGEAEPPEIQAQLEMVALLTAEEGEPEGASPPAPEPPPSASPAQA